MGQGTQGDAEGQLLPEGKWVCEGNSWREEGSRMSLGWVLWLPGCSSQVEHGFLLSLVAQ